MLWYWTRGVFNFWMVALGWMLYSWYPYKITVDNWWVRQCPLVTYTTAASLEQSFPMLTSAIGTAGYTEVAVNGWNQTSCLNAAPIRQWTATAWLLIIWYGVGWVFWITNLITDNKGGITNMLFLVYTQVFGVFAALATLALAVVANFSYG